MRNILIQGTQKLNIALTKEAIEALGLYYVFLEEKNKVMNLTTITGEKDVAELHFLDSLALLALEDFAGKRVIDIGSGAGFPGLPMKIAEQSIKLTLLDSLQKRVAFLQELCAQLNMPEVICLHARAEEAALQEHMRDGYDVAVSRAVARLNTLTEMCLPFVEPGGVFIALKGTDSDAEIKEAETALLKLNGILERIADYEIPGTGIVHRAVFIRKTAPTPDGYPRRYAKMQKSPL